MKILIDGDACPSVNLIENVAKKHNIPMEIIVDTNHNINTNYSSVFIVDKGKDNVDIFLINRVNKNDIVVTQDYGLAVMVLAKQGYAISPNGLIYTNFNIDSLLLSRHINRKMRDSGYKIRGPKKRTKADVNRLIENLEKLILDISKKI